ncbi:MAG: LysR family transcriptional regulator [Burkholderiaceae bacterium]
MNEPDLNFLYVVEALVTERSVSKAADRLGLTQPAVSHALARMRTQFQDDLFVRAGTIMAPTLVGERVAEGVARALAIIRHDVMGAKAFDAASTTRVFSVCLSDVGVIVLLPKLLAALHQHAPLATIRPIQVRQVELTNALQEGEIDLAIGYLDKMGPNLYQQSLFRRSLVGITRGNGGRAVPSMSLERFIATPHVASGTLALTNQLLESELQRQGATLKVGIEVPYLLAVPSLVANSDFIAVIPEELSELFEKLADVSVFPLPIALPDLTIQQFWHARFHNDVGHRWFRSFVAKILG